MTTKRIEFARGADPFDLREFRELLESRAFNIFRARIDRMIEDARSNCERAESLNDLKFAQGELRALRLVRELPAILERELVGKAAKEK